MLNFPVFRPTQDEREWLFAELRTARWIRTLWSATSAVDRRDPEFIGLLARASWINSSEPATEAGLALRNLFLARWLGLPDACRDAELEVTLSKRLGLGAQKSAWLVRTPTGITHYYKAQRPKFGRHLSRHREAVAQALNLVARSSRDIEAKVRRVTTVIGSIPAFTTPAGGRTTVMNGLSPLLACLDPQRRFPILNARTAKLLTSLGKSPDPDGAVALTRLIGRYGIKHSFDLDVYASGRRKFPPPRRLASAAVREARTVGFKSEQASVALLAQRRVQIRKVHNSLINRLQQALEWRHELLESEFDGLVERWRPGRKLLIEAKTTTEGSIGRAQLRQAIGQLFDYRWRSFQGQENVDLAVLTPRKPGADVLALLKTLNIEALWFKGNSLEGTVRI